MASPVRRRFEGGLEESPSLPLLLLATLAFLWIAAKQGGFPDTVLGPAALVLLGLLLVGLLALPVARPSRAQWVAIGLLAAYAAWSYLSILWAEQQGLAWDGANRAAMYAIAFALFALWPLGGRAGAAIGSVYALGVATIGLVVLLQASGAHDPTAFFDEGRLTEPTGYTNADVALWSAAAWLSLLLAGRRGVPVAVRGLLLGSAGLLTALAILGQSRGWFVILPLMLLLAVAIVPGRGRTVAAIGLVGAATALAIEPLLDVYRHFDPPASNAALVSSAMTPTLIGAGLLVLAGVAWGLVERSDRVSSGSRRRLGRGLVVAFAICCVGGLVAFSAARGNPVTKASDAWSEFKRGGSEPRFEGQVRLGELGGTYRYDYWVVGWHNFTSHPLLGVGTDNFLRYYLTEGESLQTPTYPHSVELKTLSETGLIGTAMLLGAIVAALIAAARRIGRADRLGSATAAAGVLVFAYFIVHGSLDWLWEFPSLGAPAFALLGMATAIERPASAGPPAQGSRRRVAAIAAGVVVSAALVVSLTLPWLSERDLKEGRTLAATDPAAAIEKLDSAASLDPLSTLADETAAIVLRKQGRLAASERRFRQILDRDPRNPFVNMQLALLASMGHRQREAVGLIRRTRALNPRDPVTRFVQRNLEAGHVLDPSRVDRMITNDVQQRTGRG